MAGEGRALVPFVYIQSEERERHTLENRSAKCEKRKYDRLQWKRSTIEPDPWQAEWKSVFSSIVGGKKNSCRTFEEQKSANNPAGKVEWETEKMRYANRKVERSNNKIEVAAAPKQSLDPIDSEIGYPLNKLEVGCNSQ